METQRYIELIFSSLITLLGIILSWWLKFKYGEYKNRKHIHDVSQSRLVQTILEQQLQEYGAQRVFILQRHNGGKFGNGKSMNKLSTTYEAIEDGVSAEFHNYQNLPMTLYATLVDTVVRRNAVYPVVEDIDDILTKAFFVQRGARSSMVFPIMKENDFIGMVGFEWTHKAKSMEHIYKESIEDGKILGDTLSKLL